MVRRLPSPISALQGTNDAGIAGYTGPCPRPGEMHRYLFRVYGLDDFLHIPGGSSKAALRSAMHGHILQYGETEALHRGRFPHTGCSGTGAETEVILPRPLSRTGTAGLWDQREDVSFT